MSETLLERVRRILAVVLRVPEGRVGVETEMDWVEDWTSIRHLQLVVALEQEFGKELTDAEIMECRSVRGILRVFGGRDGERESGRVSVIMPVWNTGDGCLAAVNGIFLQTWRDVELILVDDGSDDGATGGTAAGLVVLQAVAESRGLNVRVERIEHAGCSAARNRGLEVATGRWVAYNDADDISAPDRLEAQVRAMEREPWAVGCYCGVKLSTGVVVGGQEYSRGEMLAGYGLAATSALMVDRERVGDIRHRDDTMDGGYKLEVTRRGPLAVVREPMVTYRVGGGISALRGWRANREIDVATYMRELEWAMLVNRAGEIAELRRSLRRVRGALRMGGWFGVRGALGGAVVDRVARLLWPPVGAR